MHISAAGIFDCMYTVIDEPYTYLTVFNNDSTVDENTTYRYLCYASILVFINVYMYRKHNITSIIIHDTRNCFNMLAKSRPARSKSNYRRHSLNNQQIAS